MSQSSGGMEDLLNNQKDAVRGPASIPKTAATTSTAMLSDRPIRVACIGGGQLGWMMGMVAPRLNIQMYFLDPAGPNCPAAAIVPTNRIHTGSLHDAKDLQQFLTTVQPDIVTTEIEHINCDAIQQQWEVNNALPNSTEFVVRPSCAVIQLIQDKYLQKVHFQSTTQIPIPPFVQCSSVQAILDATSKLGLPIMLKSRTGAYDGRGNAVLQHDHVDAVHEALRQLGVATPPDDLVSSSSSSSSNDLMLYAEGWIDFDYEIAVMVVRSSSSTKCYPAVTAIQQNSICRVVLAPARYISPAIQDRAQQCAMEAIDSLLLPGSDGVSGVFGVEMFVTKTGQVLLNEIAPRPHNTGHYTQEACYVSQFENHLRAVCNLPLGSTQMKVPVAAMVNVLGSETMSTTMESSNAALLMENAAVHWYGKLECRMGRKMGHINLTAHTEEELDINLLKLLDIEGIDTSIISNRICQGSSTTPSTVTTKSPLVGVIMGSHSDLPTMKAAVNILQHFRIPYEVDIVSAHRTPDKLMSYARTASHRGLRVIIAGAGGAAHLPGMVAAMTPLPVIGVPVQTSTLSGIDSLYSIVQMPKGVPVATVAIGNATNAGLLAVRILSTHQYDLRQHMVQYQTAMKETVEEVSAKLIRLGSDAFLEQMDNKNTSVNV
jgi:phosphoribosylaminoimidazole carboxylase